MPPDDTPALIRRDHRRQAVFQRLYAAEEACVRAWRLWGWCKTVAAMLRQIRLSVT